MKNTLSSVVTLVSTEGFAQTSSTSNDSKNFYKSEYLDMANVFDGMSSLVLVDSALKSYLELIKEHFAITENLLKNISDSNIVKCNEKNKEKVQTK